MMKKCGGFIFPLFFLSTVHAHNLLSIIKVSSVRYTIKICYICICYFVPNHADPQFKVFDFQKYLDNERYKTLKVC